MNLTQDKNILNKRVGYLACSLLLNENSEFLILLVASLQKDLQASNINLMSNINTFKENTQNSFSTVMLELERHQKLIDFNNKKAFNEINDIKRINEENEVKQIMEEMMNNIENINLIDSLQNSKTSEYEIKQITKHQRYQEEQTAHEECAADIL